MVYNLLKPVSRQTREALFQLTTIGRPNIHTFTVLEMLSKELCSLTKLKRRASQLLSKFSVKVVMLTMTLFQA
jgi:hypothetical protein